MAPECFFFVKHICFALFSFSPSASNCVDLIHHGSKICLGQNVNDLLWRWRQICPLKINIITLSAPMSSNEVPMLNLAVERCFEYHFGLIRAIFLSLGSIKSEYSFLGHPYFELFSLNRYIRMLPGKGG